MLELYQAAIGERELQLAPYLPHDIIGSTDAARLGESLEASGDIDAVTQEIAILFDHVTDVDTDAELDATPGVGVGIACRHAVLHIGGIAQRIHDTRKLDQQAIAGRIGDAPAVLPDLRIDQLATMVSQRRQCALLVDGDEPAIASHVRRHDCGQSAGWSPFGHALVPGSRLTGL